jgi:hypothetical protein
MMDKNVLARFSRDEAVSLLIVEPFNFATGHRLSPSMISEVFTIPRRGFSTLNLANSFVPTPERVRQTSA